MTAVVAVYDAIPKQPDVSAILESESIGVKAEMREKAYTLCKEYLKGRWETIPKREFHISVLGGGLTNKLYVCRIPPSTEDSVGNSPTTVVLRIYGIIIQDFAAQIQESVVFSILSERKIGPRLYAVFPGGRLEEYIQCQTLSTQDLSDPYLSRCIAKRLASYHMMTMPVNKQPDTVMNKLQLYHDNLRNLHFDDHEKHSLFMRFLQYDISGEIEFLKQLIHDSNAPVVFCHNDLQEGNLLKACGPAVKGNPIQLIDFEYSCYNYRKPYRLNVATQAKYNKRGFDIGNHFCEWTLDYSYSKWPFFTHKPENYPTNTQQENFVQSYLRGATKLSGVTGAKWKMDFVIREANRFALLSHLFWSLWSVMQAKMSDISFGYMEYALVRMEAYHELKNRID